MAAAVLALPVDPSGEAVLTAAVIRSAIAMKAQTRKLGHSFTQKCGRDVVCLFWFSKRQVLLRRWPQRRFDNGLAT